MNGVTGVAAQQVALTQARVQTQIAAWLMKVAQETGANRVADVVRQMTQTVAETMAVSAGNAGHVDFFA